MHLDILFSSYFFVGFLFSLLLFLCVFINTKKNDFFRNWHLMKSCLEALISTLTQCLGGTLNETLTGVRNLIFASISYACKDNRWPSNI